MECQKNKDNINKIQQKRQAKTIPIKESEEELKGEIRVFETAESSHEQIGGQMKPAQIWPLHGLKKLS